MKREKWDFLESPSIYATIYIQGYPYKVLKSHNSKTRDLVALKLHNLRILNNKIIDNIRKSGKRSPEIDTFNFIHREIRGKSNYLLSEMKKGTGFEGLNKPREIILTNKPIIGPDGRKRAQWRDIFLKLDTRNPNLTKQDITLFVHELAHTGANHVTFRVDDHHQDFKDFENLIYENLP